MKGLVTEIQRFSLQDGPGIRTTVFLKGCNMRCEWCHNPETISITPQIHYYWENCINCLKCLKVCPSGAHKNVGDSDETKHIFIRELCSNCGACAKACFPGAMIMSGKEMRIEDVLVEILQDIEYYKNSGGGVTISGGEVLVQQEFAKQLLARCKEMGINTAIETNLLAPWPVIEKVLEVTDLVMFDIKHMDDTIHKTVTGVSNEGILANIKNLAEKDIPIIIRTPVIPSVNDNIADIEKICRYICKLPNLLYYELLNFNPLGESKYRSLGMVNKFSGVKPLNNEVMLKLAAAARKHDITVKVR